MSSLKPVGNTTFGRIGAFIYGSITKIRNAGFNFFPPQKLPFPVISVGGISAGGTGKTPFTAMVIDYLITEGYTPILFSRGYGRLSKENCIISADGTAPSWKKVGDEPAMLRLKYPQLWLAIGGDRMKSVKMLSENRSEKLVAIMDDGFQHRKMHRDLDIVTLPTNILSEKVIPAGLLREPLSSLKRSDCVIMMGEISVNEQKKLEELSDNAPFFCVETIIGECINRSQDLIYQTLSEPVTLISGIARPERFHKSAQERCKNVVDTIILPDHHVYSDADFERYFSPCDSAILTTEKDWVRLHGEKSVNLDNLWYLTIVVQFTDEKVQDQFFELIQNSLECYGEKSYS